MADSRSKRASKNIIVSLVCQIVTLVCGLVIPRMMIGAFGSEIYGATASISQFLAYITLLEGGIGGVARAALYKPLAHKNIDLISNIIAEIKRFFAVVGYIFIGYVLILSLFFKQISDIKSLDWLSTFFLVIVISISTFGQYFIGISYSILLQASQRTYITNYVSVMATVLNTILVMVLVKLNCNIIIVKLVSSCVFVMRPVCMWLYVKKKFRLHAGTKTEEKYLKQKYVGLGQHLAFFLHSNISVVLLTWLVNLVSVAVYSVYNMVISQIQNLTLSFTSGMEALFGDMLAKKEYEKLHTTFRYYETLVSFVSVTLFSCTSALIVPFVKVYTKGLTDADYIAPVFAVLLTLSALFYCLRSPYHSMVIAAGHFKETNVAAYGEVIVNAVVSVVIIQFDGLIGVAMGTLAATLFRFVYYVFYLSKHILNRSPLLFFKRMGINVAAIAIVQIFGALVSSAIGVNNYLDWIICAAVVAVLSLIANFVLNFYFYRSDFAAFFKHFIRRR